MRSGPALAAVTATVLAVPGAAAANTTGPISNKIVSATANVSSCGLLSGIGMSWTSRANAVTSISLTSIPSTCNGGTLTLNLVNSSNAPLGTAGPVTIAGAPQTLTLSITGSPTATSVTGSYISVVG